jgi:hypothetical protein
MVRDVIAEFSMACSRLSAVRSHLTSRPHPVLERPDNKGLEGRPPAHHLPGDLSRSATRTIAATGAQSPAFPVQDRMSPFGS